jgi:ribonuclease J
MLSLIKPRYFVPIHGEYRHVVLHARLAKEVGIAPENILVAESGQILELDGETARITGNAGGGLVLVDGLGVGDVGDVVLRDRQQLARDGFLVIVLVLEGDTGELLAEPEMVSRGFVYMRDAEELIAAAKEQVIEELGQTDQRLSLSRRLREGLGRLFYARTRRRPIILPLVMEV